LIAFQFRFAAPRPLGAAFFTAVENSGFVIGFAARRAIAPTAVNPVTTPLVLNAS
jgi:hypothetical protein